MQLEREGCFLSLLLGISSSPHSPSWVGSCEDIGQASTASVPRECLETRGASTVLPFVDAPTQCVWAGAYFTGFGNKYRFGYEIQQLGSRICLQWLWLLVLRALFPLPLPSSSLLFTHHVHLIWIRSPCAHFVVWQSSELSAAEMHKDICVTECLLSVNPPVSLWAMDTHAYIHWPVFTSRTEFFSWTDIQSVPWLIIWINIWTLRTCVTIQYLHHTFIMVYNIVIIYYYMLIHNICLLGHCKVM